MNVDRWQRVRAVFHGALDLDAAHREAHIDRESAGDAALAAEVRSLFEAHANAGAFLEEPVRMAPPAAAPETIGPYRLLQLLGRGGMGEVYLAQREDAFRKQVALKLMRSGGAFSEELVRRFHQERQILAGLEHPHIARLLDGGSTPDGAPYLVMEHVDGVPIDRWCDEQSLGVRARVQLLLAVCDGVAYAHRRLVVHRDLKPGNILVTADGTPRLVDFGIAKLLDPADDHEALATVVTLMTPEYASPEQVRGEPVTTATDVYALGVLLFRLLTGARPYRLTTGLPHELSQAICDQPPLRPSAAADETTAVARAEGGPRALQRRLSGDLDTIVLHALRKEPARRYPSVDQLSADLRAFLEGRPVSARADTVAYRAGKFIRRHRLGVAAAALLVLSLTAGLVATAWQARIARAERALAERRLDDVRHLASAFVFDVHDAIEHLPGATSARQMLVETSLRYLDALALESGDDRPLQRDLAAAYEKAGDVQGRFRSANVGDTAGAVESYRKALAIRTALIETEPDDRDLRRELLRTSGKLSDLSIARGAHDAAIEYSQRALALAEELAAADDATMADRRNVGNASLNLGWQLATLKDVDEGLTLMRRGAGIYQALLDESPDDTLTRRNLALAGIRTGEMLRLATSRLTDALEQYEQAVAAIGALLPAQPHNADLRKLHAYALLGAGSVRVRLGDGPAAREAQQQALEILRALREADPTNVDARFDTAFAWSETGETLMTLDDLHTAERYLRAAIDVLTVVPDGQPEAAGTQPLLGLSYLRMARISVRVAANRRLGQPERAHACARAAAWLERGSPLVRAAEADAMWRPQLAGRIAQAEHEVAACSAS